MSRDACASVSSGNGNNLTHFVISERFTVSTVSVVVAPVLTCVFDLIDHGWQAYQSSEDEIVLADPVVVAVSIQNALEPTDVHVRIA